MSLAFRWWTDPEGTGAGVERTGPCGAPGPVRRQDARGLRYGQVPAVYGELEGCGLGVDEAQVPGRDGLGEQHEGLCRKSREISQTLLLRELPLGTLRFLLLARPSHHTISLLAFVMVCNLRAQLANEAVYSCSHAFLSR